MAKSRTPKASIKEIAKAVHAYTWATIEAKHLLRCISIAADNAEGVSNELRPAIGLAVDGVARLLGHVEREFEHLDSVLRDVEVSNG